MQHFTSLPPNEEQQFLVYERRSVNSARSAATLGWVIAVGLLVASVAVVFAFKPAKTEEVEAPAAQEEPKKAAAAAPTAPTPAAAPASAAAAGTEAPK
mgnify:CR=1 FL=1